MSEMLAIDSKMIVKIDTKGKNKEDILSCLADNLQKGEYVKNTYKGGILKREAAYPTGLYTGGINVAVPHTDCVHVNKDAIAVGVLKEPVVFKAMDNPQKDIEVSIVIMIALKEAHGQVKMLQKILSLIKKQDQLKSILETDDTDRIYKIISNYLN
jgi:galactitol PTS system EIIA component